MNCPRCLDQPLSAFQRDGVQVDACPRCRGIWLDRGELEHLLEYSRHHDDDGPERRWRHDGDERREDHGWRDGDGRPGKDPRRVKPRRWLESLGDLFD